ncbi:Aste57867_8107 [Aphanomyces stellatus]|uniref:Aste57867_8107 protein n=1 Tax=Aphanomyces stellatus TaxID=120398 RepID=A0A485KJD0_9STRA|nr:hypothetical protein As57867_008077 [Aphanomyces stellatus]VFT84996.1 Aste57867_8107 [Aphanomyces stellatus]
MCSLCRDVVASEGALREILRSQPCGSPNALFHRSSLMEKAELFTSKFPGVAATKEVEQVLWKPCFYKRIEDFRRRIRKYASQSGNDRALREHFFKLSSEFQTFLDEAAAYYERLHGYFAADKASYDQEALRHSMFRCLIFLGDIARYRELHSQKAKKNFVAAEGYYHRALQIMPENGNPHNQLAVLATYIEAETIAVYRYCRSLLLPQPFSTAEENLVLLFERSRHRPLASSSSTASISASSPPKEKSAFLKSFLNRLTRLHGILYAPTADEVYPSDLETAVCADFAALLAAGVLGDALVLKLFVINIFCISRADGSPMQPSAVGLTLALMTIVLECVVEKPPLLGPVSVLCDFFRLHPGHLNQVPDLMTWTDALAGLLNHVTAGGQLASDADYAALKPRLKESVELRCFEPLDDTTARQPVGGPAETLPEGDAGPVRRTNLVYFASFLKQEGRLFEHQGRYYSTPLRMGSSSGSSSDKGSSNHDQHNDNGMDFDDEEEFDDEVIVFQPLNGAASQMAAAAVRAAPPSLTDSPSFGGADLSAFRHLGGGLRTLDQDLTWGHSSWPLTSTAAADNEPDMSTNPWNDLEAVERESSRYGHQVSSLSMLFDESSKDQKTSPPPPPGFNLITRNPFVVGGNS